MNLPLRNKKRDVGALTDRAQVMIVEWGRWINPRALPGNNVTNIVIIRAVVVETGSPQGDFA